MYFSSISLVGYRVSYFISDSRCHHIFGGKHAIIGACCPNCKLPLIRLLQLDMLDRKIGDNIAIPIQYIPILYCFRCDLIDEPFYYRMNDDSTISIVKYKEQISSRIHTWGYIDESKLPVYYPEVMISLTELSCEEQYLLLASYLSDYIDISFLPELLNISKTYLQKFTNIINHQIGGIPFLPQGWTEFLCPICDKQMKFLASIADEYVDNEHKIVSFTYEDIQVQSAICPDCRVIGVNHINWC